MPTSAFRLVASLQRVKSALVERLFGPPATAGAKRRRVATLHIYYALAVVDLLAVASGLALSHRLNAMLSETIATNQTWSALHQQGAELRRHARAANTVVNEYVPSAASSSHRETLASSLQAFELARERLSRQVEDRLPVDKQAVVMADIQRLGASATSFADVANTVLDAGVHTSSGVAANAKAAVDRAFIVVVEQSEQLTRHLRVIEADINRDQIAAVEGLAWTEHLIAVLVVVMVFSIVFYGRRLEEKFQRQSAKLSALNASLEQRIIERTQELASANAAIVDLNAELTRDVATLEETRAGLVHSTQLLKEQHDRFDAALENMSQGLAWFDGDMSMIICNGRYKDMYALPDHLTAPGTTFDSIFEHRVANNLFPKEMNSQALALYYETISARRSWQKLLSLPDGRHILVSHTPMANGGSLSTHADVTDHRRLEEQVAFLAAHDALTGLPNRRRLAEEIEKSFAAVRSGGSFALLCLDLDHFKRVNDTLGHGVGDRLLCMVAERLRANVRAADIVARLGGDEFAIVLNNNAGGAEAGELADRLLRDVSASYDIDGHRVVIGTSIGIAEAPRDSLVAAELLRCADLALYVAKSHGRGTYRVYETDMDASVRERRALEIDLRQAVESEEFDMNYQPLLDASSRTLHGFEALLRWHHPARGTVPPLDFIPLAEEIGLMGRIGGIVLKRACAEAAHWPAHLRIAVNVSAAQFVDRALELDVMTALATSGLAPHRLELEITESVLLECSDETMAMLQRLRNVGIRLAMDDFGTGYSSFNYLRHLPFTAIKIDRSFIKDVVTEKNAQSIIQAIVKLAECLGMSTTAEGIETEEQLSCITHSGCSEVQGFLFSRPLPSSAVRAFVIDNEMQAKRRTIAA